MACFAIAISAFGVAGWLFDPQITQPVLLVGTPVFVNELHYDNSGNDVNEGVEIAGPAGTDLTGYSVVLYDGGTGTSYATVNLSGAIPNQMNGFGTLWFAQIGIQNGSPDGLALIGPNGITVIQFLCYEGSFSATNGPANGMLCTDIGVSETGTEPIGNSLRLAGTGSIYEDFSWQPPQTSTAGSVNNGQIFSPAATSTPTLTPTNTPTSTYTPTPVGTSTATSTATATATHTPFAQAPSISTQPVVRSPGSGVSNSTVANVSDVNQTPDTLSIVVNGGTSATQNGVSVSNLSIDPSGAVTADVVAATGSADASFTMTVTDNTSLSRNGTLAVIVLSQCPGTGVWVQPSHATASDGAASDNFGNAVAISGDTVIIGSKLDDTSAGTDAGSAYVFVRSGTFWSQQQKLTASDGAAGDNFGVSVAISGDTVIVGAEQHVVSGSASGAAYVFTRSGTVWTQQQRLLAFSSGDLFGHSVALSADMALIGAPFHDSNNYTDSGAVYGFTRSGSVWSLASMFAASDANIQYYFGYSVAISGSSALVGAFGVPPSETGAAYVFTNDGGSWTQQQKLTASDPQLNSDFGWSVGISGDTAVVGSYRDSLPSLGEAGAAYVFTRSGTTWIQQQKLTAADAASSDNFGYSVGVSGDTVIVGSLLSDAADTNAGAGYVFTRSGTVWTQQQRLLAGDSSANDNYGSAAAISGDAIIIGADLDDTTGGTDSGSAYLLGKQCPATPTNTPTASPSPTSTITPTNTATSTPTPLPCDFNNGGTGGGLNPQSLTESGVAAPTGFFWSELQHDTGNSSEANALFGFPQTQGTNRLADDFALSVPCTISGIDLYGIVVGAPASPSPFTNYTLRIWNGRPGDPGSMIVFGDLITNRLSSSVDSTYYRTQNTVVPPPGIVQNTTRKIWTNSLAVNTTLPAGTYWLDWSAFVTGGGSSFSPAKTIAGARGAVNDNARQQNVSSGAWSDVVDIGLPASAPDVKQDFPFNIHGTIPSTPTSTATSTLTPTATATPGGASISGTITYGNPIGNPPPPRFVRNVTVQSTVGSPMVGPVITGTPGTYSLTGFGATSYTIKPSKPGGANTAITSADAARVAQGVAGSVPFVS